MTRPHSERPSDADHALDSSETVPRERPAEEEKVYYEGSPLVRGEVGRLTVFAVIGLLIMAVPFIYRYFQGYWPWWWVTLLFIVLGVLVWVVPFILVKAIRYRVTSYRVDFERGILSKSIDTLELWHVDDVKFNQSFLARILGVGTITIYSDDQTTPELPLRGIPNARVVFDTLKQRIITIKRQRGVIKMDGGH